MEDLFSSLNVSSGVLIKVVLMFFLKVGIFTFVIKVVTSILKPSTPVGSLATRFVSLFPAAVFAWWYTPTLIKLFPEAEDINRLLCFVFGLVINVLVIRTLIPITEEKIVEGGGENQNEKYTRVIVPRTTVQPEFRRFRGNRKGSQEETEYQPIQFPGD